MEILQKFKSMKFRPGLTNVRRVYIKQNGKVSRVIVPNLSNFRKASPELFKFKMWLLQKKTLVSNEK